MQNPKARKLKPKQAPSNFFLNTFPLISSTEIPIWKQHNLDVQNTTAVDRTWERSPPKHPKPKALSPKTQNPKAQNPETPNP